MQKISIALSVVAIALAVFLSGGGKNLAYVNGAYLVEKYKGMDEAKEKLKKLQAEKNTEFQSITLQYQQMVKAYQENQSKWSKEKLGQKGQEIGAFQQKMQQISDEMKQELAAEDQKLTQSIFKQVEAVIKEYAEENEIDMVFGANGNGEIIYSKEAYNLTETILALANKKYEGE